MSILSGLLKAGLAKKALDEARKPHNQAKLKRLVASLRKGKGRGAAGR